MKIDRDLIQFSNQKRMPFWILAEFGDYFCFFRKLIPQPLKRGHIFLSRLKNVIIPE